MRNLMLAASALALLSSPALADDALIAQGKADYEKVCASCHRIEAPDGTFISKKKIKTGPNFYGLPGRKAGAEAGFVKGSGKPKYGKALLAASEKGLVWSAENIGEFAKDPKGFLKEVNGKKLTVKMAAQRKKFDGAAIYAYLESVSAPKAE